MGSIQELFSNIIRLITYIGGGLAVVYMLYGFVRYIMASAAIPRPSTRPSRLSYRLR